MRVDAARKTRRPIDQAIGGSIDGVSLLQMKLLACHKLIIVHVVREMTPPMKMGTVLGKGYV
jgi:hypothetical protein